MKGQPSKRIKISKFFISYSDNKKEEENKVDTNPTEEEKAEKEEEDRLRREEAIITNLKFTTDKLSKIINILLM